jgi:hypothetical protein
VERAVAAAVLMVPRVSPDLKVRGSVYPPGSMHLMTADNGSPETRASSSPGPRGRLPPGSRGRRSPGSRGRRSPGPSGPGETTPVLLPTVGHACVFHHPAGDARCALHRTLGHAALPLACRQFPRVVVIDPRGASITLSHYCPTAAAMLDTDGPIAIVTGTTAFPPDGEYVGLDVRDALPPALRPDMLMDWESWWQWEAAAVALFASRTDPGRAVARLALAVEHVRDWTPKSGPLGARVASAFDAATRADVPAQVRRPFDDAAAWIVAAVPNGFRFQAETALARRSSTTSPGAHVAFLAAHAFANWTAHLGEDLRTWWRSIEAAHVLIAGGLSVRDVDLLLRHLADPRALAG